jgi:hypothetical protein
VLGIVEKPEVTVAVVDEVMKVELVVFSEGRVCDMTVEDVEVEREAVLSSDSVIDEVASVVDVSDVTGKVDVELMLSVVMIVELSVDAKVRDDETGSMEDVLIAEVELDISVVRINDGDVARVETEGADSEEASEGAISVAA